MYFLRTMARALLSGTAGSESPIAWAEGYENATLEDVSIYRFCCLFQSVIVSCERSNIQLSHNEFRFRKTDESSVELRRLLKLWVEQNRAEVVALLFGQDDDGFFDHLIANINSSEQCEVSAITCLARMLGLNIDVLVDTPNNDEQTNTERPRDKRIDHYLCGVEDARTITVYYNGGRANSDYDEDEALFHGHFQAVIPSGAAQQDALAVDLGSRVQDQVAAVAEVAPARRLSSRKLSVG